MELLSVDLKETQKSVVERIFEHSKLNPDNIAIICDDEEVTYRNLTDMIVSISHFLKNLGIQKGDGVAIQSMHSKYCIASYYAIHLLGAILIPLEKSAPEDRMIEISNDTDAKLVIADHEINDERYISYSQIIDSTDTIYEYDHSQLDYPSLNDICEMVFTTGTTGKSKGVLINHLSMSYYAYSVAKAVEMKKNNRFFITTPLNHAGGLRRTHLSLANGCTVIYMDGLMNLKKYFEYIDKYHATSLYLPPVAIRLLMNSAKKQLGELKDKIDFVYSSSSSLPEGDCKALAELLPHTRLYNAYEASETPGVSVYDYNNDAMLKGCMGKANEGVKLALLVDGKITDEADVQGQICIQSPMNMKGYYKADDITASVFKDGWYVSSDLGHFDKQGNIYYDGRTGDVINIGGYKIAPTDVEEVALLYENIKECICIEAENKLGMPILKLLVVPKNEEYNSKELLSIISSKLENYKVPKQVETIDEVHKTFNGKIDRKFYRNK